MYLYFVIVCDLLLENWCFKYIIYFSLSLPLNSNPLLFEAFEFIKKDVETGLNEVLATCPKSKVPIPGSGK